MRNPSFGEKVGVQGAAMLLALGPAPQEISDQAEQRPDHTAVAVGAAAANEEFVLGEVVSLREEHDEVPAYAGPWSGEASGWFVDGEEILIRCQAYGRQAVGALVEDLPSGAQHTWYLTADHSSQGRQLWLPQANAITEKPAPSCPPEATR
jgi:hypothetical protein